MPVGFGQRLSQTCFRIKAETLTSAAFWMHIGRASIVGAGFAGDEIATLQEEAIRSKLVQFGRDNSSTADVAEKLSEFTRMDHVAGAGLSDPIAASITQLRIIAEHESHLQEPELIDAAKSHIELPGNTCANALATVPGIYGCTIVWWCFCSWSGCLRCLVCGVCACMCMCVCVYVCMCVYVYVCVCVCECMCV